MAFDIHAPVRLSAFAPAAKQFAGWWIQEIAGLAPKAWISKWAELARRPKIMIEDGTWVVVGAGPELDGRHACSSELPGALAEAIGGRAVEIRLPKGAVLLRTLTMPDRALAHLSDAARLQLERLSPLPVERTLWDTRVLTDANGTAYGACAIADREAVEPVINAFREAGVKQFTVRDSEGQFTFWTEDADARLRQLAVMSLCVLGLALCASAFALGMWRTQDRIAELRAEIETLKPDAEASAALRREVEAASALSDRLDVALRGPKPLEIWLEATNAVPDTAWLTAFELTKEELRLEGYAKDSAAVLSGLAASRMIANPVFDGALQRQPEFNADRFSVRADVRGPAAP